MSDYLLVPTNVQAFVVGSPGDQVYDLAPVPRTEDDVAEWYDDTNQHARPFVNSKLPALAAGVHLHWAPPAALMHSRHADSAPEQSYIPNRWLVLRMWHGQGNTNIASKAWVVESDYVSREPAPGSTPFPFCGPNPPVELNGQHCGYVGRALPLERWQETHPAYRFELTSSGWGDPSFAAYYPACQGVLGFHDELEGVKTGDALTYLVIGWYSDPDRDPLHQVPPWQAGHGYGEGDLVTPTTPNGYHYRVTTAGTAGSSEPSWPAGDTVTNGTVVFAKHGPDVFARLRWSCSDWKDAALPLSTLCHGGGVGVKWQGATQKYPAASGGSAPTVAIGGSAAEALAALLTGVPAHKSLQHILCAFQHGQATHVTDDDQLGDLLHRHGFNAAPGGTLWSVEPIARTTGAQASPPPLSPQVQKLLADLNQAQQAHDRHVRTIDSLRWRLFACWATWASQRARPPRDTVDPATDALNQATTGLRQFTNKVEDRKNSVTTALGAENTGMRLVASTMPPFLQPKDPFVVLQGENLVGIDRTRPRCPDKKADEVLLPCRLAKDVVTGVSQSGVSSQTWLAQKCFSLNFPNVTGVSPGEVARTLAFETLLFDPHCAGLLDTPDHTLDLQLFAALQESLATSPRSDATINTLTWAGQPPDPLGLTRWGARNPWLPVYLMWQANWGSAYARGEGSNNRHSGALAGWQLESARAKSPDFDPPVGDLVPQAGSVQPQEAVPLEGATLISALSGSQLAEHLKEFAEATNHTPDQLERVRQTQVLGQSLGGWTDLLLRQTLGLFLPPGVVDPESTSVWGAMEQRPQPVMPVNSSFYPVRAGALQLVNLWIVDTFGQTWKLIDSDKTSKPTVIASALLPPSSAGYHAGFSPRLAQPARLNFDWRPADSDASGPVCGWIVANFLEKSFAVFSASGVPLGALESVLPALGEKTIQSHVTFRWRPIPGSQLDISGIGNERLRRFVDLVRRLTADEGQAFLELVDLVLGRTEERLAAEDPAMAVLLGRPLALVHASLGLEVQGLPAGYWNTDVQPWRFETEAFETLRVPVRLGGMHLPADGLVGYVPENGQPCLFASDGASRRLGATRPDGSHSLIQYDQDLSVACDGSPVSLTLLMDASARVHATTGILPRHQVGLPPEAARLAGLIKEIYFSVAPVLGARPHESAAQPTMPRPSDAFGQWSWATRPDLTPPANARWSDILPADDRARFPDSLTLAEGWLRLRWGEDHGNAVPSDQT